MLLIQSIRGPENSNRGPDNNEGTGGEGDNKKNRWPHRTGLIGIIIVLVLAWLYFFYPTVTIKLRPVTKIVEREITVNGSLSANKIDRQNNVLPLHRFEVTVEDRETVDTSGERTTGKTRATGTVKFINERKQEVEIPDGTVVVANSGIKFETIQSAVVPGLKVEYLLDVAVGMEAGQKEVDIRALTRGTAGNVATGEIDKLAEPRENIYVINPGPTRGGEDTVRPVVAERDREKVKDNLRERMKTRLLNKMYRELGGNYRLLEEEIEYSPVDVTFSHQVGDVTPELTGEAVMEARGYLIRNNELDRLVTHIFREEYADGIKLLGGGINIRQVKLAEKEQGLYNIILRLAAPVIPEIAVKQLTDRLKGKKLSQAKSVLNSQNNIEEFTISADGGNLPRFGPAIKVVIEEPEAYQVINIGE